jgi:hypothetical protein
MVAINDKIDAKEQPCHPCQNFEKSQPTKLTLRQWDFCNFAIFRFVLTLELSCDILKEFLRSALDSISLPAALSLHTQPSQASLDAFCL